MSKRFERIARSSGYDHRGIMRAHSLNPDTDPALVTDAHSEAIEGLEERTDKLGRNLDMVERKLIAVDAALTERVAALEGADNAPSYVLAVLERRMARLEDCHPHTAHPARRQKPTPEPVVVEGEVVAMTRNYRRSRWELVVEAYHPRLQRGDLLTIERVEDE